MKWKDKVFEEVLKSLKKNEDWIDIKNKLKSGRNDFGVHVGIFAEPYLTLITQSKKTIESRFSVNKISPYGKIFKGDIVLVKKTGGPIVGMFVAGEVLFYPKLNNTKLKEIEDNFGEQICTYVNPNFWTNRAASKFATLISIDRFIEIKPFTVNKSDRMAWSIVQNRLLSLFDN